MNYDDIINMKHPTSINHPRMSMNNRAAQFAPFAALKTHVDKISEAGRLTTQKPFKYARHRPSEKWQRRPSSRRDSESI